MLGEDGTREATIFGEEDRELGGGDDLREDTGGRREVGVVDSFGDETVGLGDCCCRVGLFDRSVYVVVGNNMTTIVVKAITGCQTSIKIPMDTLYQLFCNYQYI